jgi:thiamine biosynthesis lipoprotein
MVHNIGFAQGTSYSIKYFSEGGLDYQNEIDSIFIVVDKSMSSYFPNSLISKLNNGERDLKLDSHFIQVFSKFKFIAGQTDGLFDCSIYPIMQFWDFDNFGETSIDTFKIKEILQFVGYQNMNLNADNTLDMPIQFMLDFNSIAQGYTVDVISSFLDSMNMPSYLVEVGGEVRASGVNTQNKFWRIGIDKPSKFPDAKDRFQVVVELDNKSLATSGNYRKFYIKDGVMYSHTINPITGFPVQHSLLSVSVVAEDCMSADAYATAFMVMGVDKTKSFLIDHPELDAFLIYSDKKGKLKTWNSDGFKDLVLN